MKKDNILSEEKQSKVQEEMFRTLLNTPHRQIDETLHIHKQQFDRDPNFYGKLAVWSILKGNNVVRDVNEVFLAVLFDSPYQEHMEAAYVMLQDFPPYQVARICDIFTGWEDIEKFASYDKKKVPSSGQFGVTVSPAKFGKSHPQKGQEIPRKNIDLSKSPQLKKELVKNGVISGSVNKFHIDTYLVQHAGLNHRRFKGLLKRAVRSYLKFREKPENTKLMERACLRSKNFLKRLYAKSNLLPQSDENGWINQYLFHNKADSSSTLSALVRLAASQDPVEQSKIIMDEKIPYQMATSAIKNITPSILVSLVDVMSPQELLSNLSSLQKRGAMDNPDLKQLIEGKLLLIKKIKSKRIDAMKGAVAAKIEGLDEDIKKLATEVSDAQLKHHGLIKCNTCLAIDKSGSMHQAIEIGKFIGSIIAQAAESPDLLTTYMFDDSLTPIVFGPNDGDPATKSSWDNKLKMFKANGSTCANLVAKALLQSGKIVEQIVLVTDEGENGKEYFATVLKRYANKFGIMPSVVIVRIGPATNMQHSLEAEGFTVDVLNCNKIDDVSAPNILRLLSKKSIFELIQEILTLHLPIRSEWDKKHLNIAEGVKI